MKRVVAAAAACLAMLASAPVTPASASAVSAPPPVQRVEGIWEWLRIGEFSTFAGCDYQGRSDVAEGIARTYTCRSSGPGFYLNEYRQVA